MYNENHTEQREDNKMRYKFNDGGRLDAGFKGKNAGDCVVRAIAIAFNQGYRKTKAELNELLIEMTGGLDRSCNDGTPTPVSHKYLTDNGWKLKLTKGCYVDSLPTNGLFIACLPCHKVTVINGTFNDTWDSRKSRRTSNGLQRLEGYYYK